METKKVKQDTLLTVLQKLDEVATKIKNGNPPFPYSEKLIALDTVNRCKDEVMELLYNNGFGSTGR